ncbi:hypothetical protein BK266_27930 [Escherichia coli]|nr:hypothetical protein BK266_27930 [Escherichia coli]
MEDFRFFDIYTDAWHSPIVQKEYILPDASLPILPVYFCNFIVNEFVLEQHWSSSEQMILFLWIQL